MLDFSENNFISFCSAILGTERRLNRPLFSEIAWLCHAKKLNWENPFAVGCEPEKQGALILSWGSPASIWSHASKFSGRITVVNAKFLLSSYFCSSFWILIFPSYLTTFTCLWCCVSRALNWCRSAASLSLYEENCKVMVSSANFTPPELCSDQEIIHYCSCLCSITKVAADFIENLFFKSLIALPLKLRLLSDFC